MLEGVSVPEPMRPVFERAQELVRSYFSDRIERPSEGTIEIHGERYILVRASSMAVEFFENLTGLFREHGTEEAQAITRNLLFDVAHTIGMADARAFHRRLNLKDPIERLSAGPLHFAHTGWANVDIHPESRPVPNEDYFLVYDHPYSFESDSWLRAGKRAAFPVCVMNAGYSSGWCQESFGVPLLAAEILCQGRGDEVCRFVMAHPRKIQAAIQRYLDLDPTVEPLAVRQDIAGYFSRQEDRERRIRAEEQREHLIQELEAKNTELEQFAYTVSHDLKSPLITINGYLGMVEQSLASRDLARAQADMGRIRRATERMEILLDELLELSRVGRLANPSESVSLDELAREAIEMADGLIQQQSVEVAISADLPVVTGDRVRLLEVLQNLVENATKFMGDQEQPRIEIGMRPGDPPITTVRDNGIGILPDQQTRIFDLFEQLNGTADGSGLGLTLVRRIIESHGGRIWVESDGPGQGSTFCFTIPPATS